MTAEAILSRLELLGIKLGLESTRRILRQLGDPQAGMSVVLVAGTNGKGSTAALIAAMAVAGGYRTGLFTSPHVERVEERIRLDGVAIATDRLGGILLRVVVAAEESVGHSPTYFEALTEAAYLFFAEEGVDLAVMETGLGGRLDATNVGEPVLSVITEIGFDHTQQLGTTLGRIAREKAGILRRGRPALAWVGDQEARQALCDSAVSIGADLEMVSERRSIVEAQPLAFEGQRVVLVDGERRYDLALRLSGHHQLRNLALAVRSAEVLADLGWTGIDVAAVERGVAGCHWPGRLELVEVPTGSRVLLDAAHNPQAIAALVDFLSAGEDEFDLVFGALLDKQVEEMLPMLASRAKRVILTAPDSPRAVPPEDLRALLADREHEVETMAPVSRALDRALERGGRLVVACGSIYLVGEARRHLRHRYGTPPPVAEISVGPRSSRR